ncbi:SixA phosphatase family protein [Aquimarina mytili]|uniref:Histidine phosphatase family protein n=1 Tax=Aquimarina mytili TaxID=874423 RepID=A0A937DAS3_9FLAO|nr:histidine phosphatase family protein [Aquimarina mytili]MBL0683036.1 histidine phosphatase family protein [Aquimarina mytili]
MKTLYIIRHAKSSWDYDVSDEMRPLNKRGLNDAALIGKELKTLIKPVDKIISSPAVRAHSTAKIVMEHLDVDKSIFSLEPDLYDFGGQNVIEVIKNCNDNIDTLMIFGHNHALTSISNLYGSEKIDNLPTAGVVGIEFDTTSWKNINVGKNLLIIFPKSLR